ncbi:MULTISPECIES: OmpW family outer membrane protein [unclassified Alcanivorax]|jgi:outer membrane protein|uniref:OmpW/AlkL family protein n=1 Tax=unclassified Alcanivorax TaxID=2638842 RepID=UPI00017ECB96|nr:MULTISPECIES: OmpW family outer membrane protein [unclassified Alcanivorax]EDX89841.1 OmpW family [Alcanivorax sp. DG881]
MKLRGQGKSVLMLSTVLLAGPVMAHQSGDFIVRMGGIKVAPDVSSDAFDSALPVVGGLEVDVDDDTQLGLTFAYMVTDSIGVELVGATPFTHDIILDTGGSGVVIGETSHLPPTLLAQFYAPQLGPVRGYLGAGVNYTLFFDDSIDDAVVSPLLGGADVDVKLSNSVGFAWEVGADFLINENWLLNASVWNIDIDTEARLYVNDARVDKIDVEIDPWVYMVGVGYRF